MSDDQNTRFPLSEPKGGVLLSLHRPQPGSVEPVGEPVQGLLANAKADDRVGLLVKGNYGAGRTRIIDVITQDLEKATGKKPPYYQIEGGAMFDVNGHCCRPPKDAIMQHHFEDVRITPWTEKMEATFNRGEHVRYFKESCEWGRLSSDDLAEIVKLLGAERQACLHLLKGLDFGAVESEHLEAIALIIQRRTDVDGVF